MIATIIVYHHHIAHNYTIIKEETNTKAPHIEHNKLVNKVS